MASYVVPVLEVPTPVAANEVLLIASGDLRLSANQVCWPAQSQMEAKLTRLSRRRDSACAARMPTIRNYSTASSITSAWAWMSSRTFLQTRLLW